MRRYMTALVTVLAIVVPAGGAASASIRPESSAAAARTSPTFTRAADAQARPLVADLTTVYWGYWFYNGDYVYIYWGYDYNRADNRLRAWGKMLPTNSSTRLQAEPLELDGRSSVLQSITGGTQSGTLELETAPVGCGGPSGYYNSNLHYSIRWPDGTVTDNQQTGASPYHSAVDVCP
jgi:hypothetical protein